VKDVGKRRVAHVAVQSDDPLVGLAQGRQRDAVGPTGRHLLFFERGGLTELLHRLDERHRLNRPVRKRRESGRPRRRHLHVGGGRRLECRVHRIEVRVGGRKLVLRYRRTVMPVALHTPNAPALDRVRYDRERLLARPGAQDHIDLFGVVAIDPLNGPAEGLELAGERVGGLLRRD